MTGPDDFEAFVLRYQDMVFATAVRLLGNPDEAQDIAQTVFLKAFQRFDEIGPSEAAGGWLKTVARNAALNHLTRYRARWRFFSELDREGDAGEAGGGDSYESTLAASAGTPASEAEAAAEREALEQALRQLPDHQRVPIVLFHFEDMSYQDIAATLGVSLGKLKTDIHRGREALRRILAPRHASR